MFCEVGDGSFIKGFLMILSVIIAVVFLYEISKLFSALLGIMFIYGYTVFTIGEFQHGHTIHGLIPFLPIVILIIFFVYIYREEKKRTQACSLLPGIIENYIMYSGFTAPHLFKKYSEEQPEFATARSVQYTNPVYTMKVKENNQRKARNQKPIEITVPQFISYSSFAEYKYKETVLTQFMVELPKVMYTIFMFDYENLYDTMMTFQNFFKRENGTVDMVYFQQASISVIKDALADNTIEKVGGNNNLFRSKTIPEEEGNVVEGDVIEL